MASLPAVGAAPASPARAYDIPAGPLGDVLARFGRNAEILLSFRSELTTDLRSEGLHGSYTVQEGLARLLAGTGIQAHTEPDGSYLLERNVVPLPTPAPTMPLVTVHPQPNAAEAYPGGQIARQASLGILGTADVMDLPVSTVSYTANLLENLQARTLADVVPNEASARVLTSSGGFGEDFQIRGLPVASGDVGLNGLYGMASSSRMPALMMERVEVMKGPGTLMNGVMPNGSLGGTINIVTKRATDEPLTRLTTVYQSAGQWGQQADISRRFGEDGRWGIRFNGAFRDGETAIERSNQRQSIGVLSLDYAGTGLKWSMDAYTQHEAADNVRPQVGFAPSVSAVPPPPSGRKNFFPGTRLEFDDTVVATRVDYDVTDAIQAYGAAGYRYGTADQTLPSGLVDAVGGLTVRNGYYDSYSRTGTGEIGLRIRFDAAGLSHALALGTTRLLQETGNASAQSDDTYRTSIYDATPIPELSMHRRSPGRASNTSLSSWYLADTVSTQDERLRFTLGLRHQDITLKNHTAVDGASTPSRHVDALSPLAGVVFKPLEHVSFYANFASGVTRGGIAPPTSVNAGQVLPPYKSRQYEAGVKVDWGTLRTQASVFTVKVPNAAVNPRANLYSVNGDDHLRGLEISAHGELRRGLRVMASGAFYDATLTNTAGGLADGNRANGVPSHTFNLGLDWDVPGVRGLSLNAGLIYTSSVYFNAANTISLPGWTRYDVGARYRTTVAGKAIVLRANIQNLFDKNVWLASGDYATISAPRTLLLSAQMDF